MTIVTPAEALPAWAAVGPRRLGHVRRVVALLEDWAVAMRLPDGERARWCRAGWLHDALRDAPEAALRALADRPGPVELLHGPAAAARARAEGETDEALLLAVAWHSLGHADWDGAGDALYCADFLEPGRSFERERRAALAARYPADPAGVLREVAAWRLGWLMQSGWPIPEMTRGFWNRIVGGQA